MTAIDVLDDAVKIGLGALLAILGASLGHRREWKRERARRQLELIEKIAKDFESAHNAFLDYVIDVGIAKAGGEKYQGSHAAVTTTRRAVLELVAIVTVTGATDMETAIRNYAVAVSKCLHACDPESAGTALSEASDQLEKERKNFHRAMRAEYVKTR